MAEHQSLCAPESGYCPWSSSSGLYMSREGESPPPEKPTLHAYTPPLTQQAQLHFCSSSPPHSGIFVREGGGAKLTAAKLSPRALAYQLHKLTGFLKLLFLHQAVPVIVSLTNLGLGSSFAPDPLMGCAVSLDSVYSRDTPSLGQGCSVEVKAAQSTDNGSHAVGHVGVAVL